MGKESYLIAAWFSADGHPTDGDHVEIRCEGETARGIVMNMLESAGADLVNVNRLERVTTKRKG